MADEITYWSFSKKILLLLRNLAEGAGDVPGDAGLLGNDERFGHFLRSEEKRVALKKPAGR